MEISDALPIQFWLPDQVSYNDTPKGRIDKYCFIKEVLCSDTIRLQFTDTDQIDYVLRFVNSDGEETDIPFEYEATALLTEVDTWDQFGFETPWDNVGTDNPTVSVAAAAQSNSLRGYSIGVIPGGETVLISFKFTVTGDAMDVIFKFRLAGSGITPLFVSVPVAVGVTELSFEYTGDSDWDDMTVEVINTSGSTGNLYIDYIRGYRDSEEESISYSLSLIPQDNGLCEETKRLYIINPSTEAVVAYSDLIRFSEYIAENIFIQYKSIKNFAGIIYDENSEYFSIRIPGVFFHERNPTDQKSLQLSNSRIVNTSSVLKKQKLFEIQDCPYYMHTKIQLILQHAVSGSVVINGVEWKIEEPYEIDDSRPDTYPMRSATTYLTRKNYLKRNVI